MIFDGSTRAFSTAAPRELAAVTGLDWKMTLTLPYASRDLVSSLFTASAAVVISEYDRVRTEQVINEKALAPNGPAATISGHILSLGTTGQMSVDGSAITHGSDGSPTTFALSPVSDMTNLETLTASSIVVTGQDERPINEEIINGITITCVKPLPISQAAKSRSQPIANSSSTVVDLLPEQQWH